MIILAFTDIHGAYQRVEEIVSATNTFDVLVIGGDLTNRADPADAEAAMEKFLEFGKPVLVVAGNMDLPTVEERYRRMGIGLNANGCIIDGVGFFGVSGCPPTPMHTPYEIPEEEIARRIEEGWRTVQNVHRHVFVPHVPPYSTTLDRTFFGTHVGSISVRAFVEKHHPDILICGHIHEARGRDTLGSTEMVNCGAGNKGHYAVIEIGERIRVENRSWPG